MAEREDEQGKSEPASPFKLKEARDRGVVAKSTELNAVAVGFAFVGALYLAGQDMFERQLRQGALLLSQAHQLVFTESAVSAWLAAIFADAMGLLAPVFGALIVAGIVA